MSGVGPATVKSRAYLGECSSCSSLVARRVGVDLDHVPSGVLTKIDPLVPGIVEHRPVRSRCIVVDSRVDRANLGVADVVAILLGGCQCSRRSAVEAPERSVPVRPPVLLFVVASCVVGTASCFAYCPSADPAYELVASTLASRVTAALARMAVVVGLNSAVIEGAVARFGIMSASFTLMATVSLLGPSSRPARGLHRRRRRVRREAGDGVLGVRAGQHPMAVMWRPLSQYAHLAAAAVLLSWTRRESAYIVSTMDPSRRGRLPWT
jgi:hypothetical protein